MEGLESRPEQTVRGSGQISLSGSQGRFGQALVLRSEAGKPTEQPAADLYAGVLLLDSGMAVFS